MCEQLTRDLLAIAKFLFFSFFVFFAMATGRTVHQMWTDEGLKRVVPHKEVFFGGLNVVFLNFWGHTPKTEFWGRE